MSITAFSESDHSFFIQAAEIGFRYFAPTRPAGHSAGPASNASTAPPPAPPAPARPDRSRASHRERFRPLRRLAESSPRLRSVAPALPPGTLPPRDKPSGRD